MTEEIVILDFGSQYTQVIARRVRECNVFSTILRYDTPACELEARQPKGIILSGGPSSVYAKDAPLPDPDVPAPVRFLPHWDAVTLAHARRTGILPEEHRAVVYHIRNPASVGTVAVDGRIVAGWRFRDGGVAVEWLEAVGPKDRDAVEDERLALEAFSA